MTRFRRKAEEVEARRIDGTANDSDTYVWIRGLSIEPDTVRIDPDDGRMVIVSADRKVHCNPGDWIARGSDGRFSVYNPTRFEATFAEVGDARDRIPALRPEAKDGAPSTMSTLVIQQVGATWAEIAERGAARAREFFGESSAILLRSSEAEATGGQSEFDADREPEGFSATLEYWADPALRLPEAGTEPAGEFIL